MIGLAEYLAELCRLYVFVTLAIAVVGKTLAIGPFIASMAHLLGLRRSAARYIASGVIVAEAAVAVLLLSRDLSNVGMGAALLLFVAMTAILANALARRRVVHCNCFGGRGHRVSAHDLGRNATLIAAASWYLYQRPATPLDLTSLAPLLGAALILFLISAHLREIVSLCRSTNA